MREYGQIQTSFWTDPDMQAVSSEAKLLAAYMLTGPHSNGLGCYRLPAGYIAEDMQWSLERVSETLSQLLQTGFMKRCSATSFVLIPKFLRWNPIANANVAKARVREFDTISTKAGIYSDLCREMLDYGKHWEKGFANRLETLAKQYSEQDPDPDPDPEKTQTEESSLRSDSCAKPQSGCAPPADKTDEPVFIHVPLVDKTHYPITESQVAEWKALYPAVDVRQALRTLVGWNTANRARRKTRSGVLRHVNGWLAKEQNKGGGACSATSPTAFGGKRDYRAGEAEFYRGTL